MCKRDGQILERVGNFWVGVQRETLTKGLGVFLVSEEGHTYTEAYRRECTSTNTDVKVRLSRTFSRRGHKKIGTVNCVYDPRTIRESLLMNY